MYIFRIFCLRSCSTSTNLILSTDTKAEILQKKYPVFTIPRTPKNNGYELIEWKNKEMISNYVLFEDSMKKIKVSWSNYNGMTSEEKTIYLNHYYAVQEKKLNYKCSITKQMHKTISQLLYNNECCGEGCRHCPYELENCDHSIKKSLIWNGAYYV